MVATVRSSRLGAATLRALVVVGLCSMTQATQSEQASLIDLEQVSPARFARQLSAADSGSDSGSGSGSDSGSGSGEAPAPTFAPPDAFPTPAPVSGPTTAAPTLAPDQEVEIYLSLGLVQPFEDMTSNERASLQWNCLLRVVERVNAAGGSVTAGDATRTVLSGTASRRRSGPNTVFFSAYFAQTTVSPQTASATASNIDANPVVVSYAKSDGSTAGATSLAASARVGTTPAPQDEAVDSSDRDYDETGLVVGVVVAAVVAAAIVMAFFVTSKSGPAKDDTTTISNQNAAFDPNAATLQEPFLPGTAAAFEEPDHAGFRPVNRRDSLLLNGHSEPSDQELVLVSVV
eukprot:m.460881 g.460881  ORF g.460881 m.460881 type:complete len:346 (-) comp22162_c0_seq1:200-1237(-)